MSLRRAYTLLIALLFIQHYCHCQDSVSPTEAELKEKVRSLMAKMTLADKCGEMTQITMDVISEGEIFNATEPHTLDIGMLRHVLLDLRVGSLLNTAGHAYTSEHWHEIMRTVQGIASEKATGIPVIFGIDAIHGNNFTMGSTLFPQQIAIAATFNPALAERVAEATAYETRASFIPWNFSPVLDIGRDPRWSRFWETFGEDVLLTTRMGEAYVRGYEGKNPAQAQRVASCLKHFVGYSAPTTGKDRTRALLPERQLREYYLPPFKKAIEAGASTIMINSGELNGIPVHADQKILKSLLRDELGFTGLVVSDWEDVGYLYSRHRVASDFKDAIRIAINAGIDMAMVPIDLQFPVLLKELVEEGKIPMSRIDEAVERILKVKFKIGLFDNPYHESYSYDLFASKVHAEIALQAASEAVTLLRNERNTLPISKKSRVLVTGPTANSMMPLNGGWTRTWQGDNPDWDSEDQEKTILEAIRDVVGNKNVVFVDGNEFAESRNLKKMVSSIRSVDVVVVCLGEMPYCETPGDISDLALPASQRQLVEAASRAGKPVVVVLVEGRPRIITDFVEKTDAILMGYLPGNKGGEAIARALFGDLNPGGRLPFSYPRSSNELYTYDQRTTDIMGPLGAKPLFEFGHGLSYTQFSYSNLRLSSDRLSPIDSIEISVNIKNTGMLAGHETALLFITDKVASITPSLKRLRGFQKVWLEAGEERKIKFVVRKDDLAFVGVDLKWVTEEGEFDVSIGGERGTFVYKDSQLAAR